MRKTKFCPKSTPLLRITNNAALSYACTEGRREGLILAITHGYLPPSLHGILCIVAKTAIAAMHIGIYYSLLSTFINPRSLSHDWTVMSAYYDTQDLLQITC